MFFFPLLVALAKFTTLIRTVFDFVPIFRPTLSPFHGAITLNTYLRWEIALSLVDLVFTAIAFPSMQAPWS